MQATPTASAALQANLAALALHQPAVAARIEAAALESGFEPAAGRDAAATFRIHTAEGPIWLGHSSMPTVSAAALLADFKPGPGSVALPGLGHGWEARLLLNTLQPHQCVFTLDSDPRRVALGLRLHDFSAALRAARLVLGVHEDPAAALEQCFAAHPNHVAPTRMLSAPHLAPEHIQRLQAALESAGAAQHRRLGQRVRDARERILQQGPPPGRMGRLLILSMIPDPRLARAAEALAAAAAELGIEARVHVADGPGRTHLAAAAEALVGCWPHGVLLLNQIPAEFGDLLGSVPQRAAWFLSPSALRPELRDQLAGVNPLWITGHELARQVREAHPDAAHAKIVPPAANPAVFRPDILTDSQRRQFGSAVAMIQDAAPATPEAMGFKWDSHKFLLAEIVAQLKAEERWVDEAGARRVLREASRRCRVTIDEGPAQRTLLGYIRDWLGPTAFVLALARRLQYLGVGFKVWGSQWDLHEEGKAMPAGPVPSDEERNMIYNASGVVVIGGVRGNGPERVLEVLAAGAKLLLAGRLTGSCGEPAEVIERVPSCSDAAEACGWIQRLQAGDRHTERSLAEARDIAGQRHAPQHRLAEVVAGWRASDR